MDQYCIKYLDDIFIEDFNKLSNQSHFCEKELQVVELENAFVLPFKKNDILPFKGLGGICDQNKNYLDLSATKQEDIMPFGYSFKENNIEEIQESVVYMGYFIKQWGHFLADFIPRLWWILKNYAGEKIVVLVSDINIKIDGNYLEILRLFGIDESKIIYCHKILKCKSIIVPEMAMVRPYFYTKEMKNIYNEIINRISKDVSYKSYDKIYFTRKNLRKAKLLEQGEEDIEKIFLKNGFKIISPEKCSLKKLIFLINKCKVFCSLSGTIPHNIVFAGENTKCIIINKTYRINLLQFLLNEISNKKPYYIDCHISLLPTSPGIGPFLLDVNENLLRFLRDFNYKIPKNYVNFHRLNRYKNAMKKKKRLSKYFLQFLRITNEHLDIGGNIIGSSRPNNEFENKNIYFYYRKKYGEIFTNTNFASSLTSYYNYFKYNKIK